jgi:acetyl esterase
MDERHSETAERTVIGEIPNLDEIADRLLPLWRAAIDDPATAFVMTRRLKAAAIGRHLRAMEGERDYLDEFITLPGREIPFRLYRVAAGDDGPVTVYFHGGGWVSGNLDTHHGMCLLLREKLNGPVVSIHTRRAPENPFPAQVEDALDAIAYLQGANGFLSIGPKGFILAGDSAGAFTAFHAALALAGRYPLTGLLLFYPAVEPAADTESYRRHAGAPGLTAETMRGYWNALIGKDDALRTSLSLDAMRMRAWLWPARSQSPARRQRH